jgi:hypothetical protein
VDRTVFRDGRGAVTTPSLSTSGPQELLVAFVSQDGPGGAQTGNVTGGGLTWTLARRANSVRGNAEVWTAFAANPLTNVTVTATMASGSYDQSLTVVAFTGAVRVAAIASGSATTGAPTLNLSTTQGGSFVYAVGHDWDRAVARTLGAGSSMVHEWVDTPVGDTTWVQSMGPFSSAAIPVTVNCTAPTNDQWNYVAVEVVRT